MGSFSFSTKADALKNGGLIVVSAGALAALVSYWTEQRALNVLSYLLIVGGFASIAAGRYYDNKLGDWCTILMLAIVTVLLALYLSYRKKMGKEASPILRIISSLGVVACAYVMVFYCEKSS